ncbi:hypothetical protein [Bacillus subtilis]|uniref:hypothetical protein n=1 Tax=Bacillus subtilis TaxID=1423 RepID=UPI00201CBC98|nr:hypothetical protein [Bacillus subtilis]UQZ52605.1 hypothetical protein C2H94_19820 [Bacillus subtilis]UQZ63271.1 hypothetical protein C2H95_12635 [Bacillus subtilis]
MNQIPINKKVNDLSTADCTWPGLNDLTCKVDELLREIKSTVPNAICFAITDRLLTYYAKTLFTYTSENILLDQERLISIAIRDYRDVPTDDGDHTSILVRIDPQKEIFEFTISLRIEFYEGNKHFATAKTQFLLKSRPNLNADFLEFLTFSIQLLTPQDSSTITIVDQIVINNIYGNTEGFISYLNSLMLQFTDITTVNESSTVNWVLPAIVNSFHLPEDWRYVQGVILQSPEFYYKEVRLMGNSSGCLFIVFSVQSLNQPFPCICEEFPDNGNYTPSLWSNTRRQLAIGISQDAFFEILKPVVDSALHISHSDSIGNREIKAEISYWTKGEFSNLRVLGDGFYCDFKSLEAGGYISAAVKFLKRTIWKEKVGLKVQLNDTSLRLSQFKLNTDINDNTIKITAFPKVKINNINTEMSPDLPPIEWVTDHIANSHKEKLEKQIQNSLTFHPFKRPLQMYPGGIMFIESAWAGFYENSSFVMAIQMLWWRD